MKCAIILRDGPTIVMEGRDLRADCRDNGALVVSTVTRTIIVAPGAWLRYDSDPAPLCCDVIPATPSPNHPVRADLDAPPSS